MFQERYYVKWRKEFDEFGSDSFPGQGNEKLTEEGRKVKELEKVLRECELERLKKAIAILHKSFRHTALGNLTITEFFNDIFGTNKKVA